MGFNSAFKALNRTFTGIVTSLNKRRLFCQRLCASYSFFHHRHCIILANESVFKQHTSHKAICNDAQSISAVWHFHYSPCCIERSEIRFVKCAVADTRCADDWRCKTEQVEHQVRQLHFVHDETRVELRVSWKSFSSRRATWMLL